MERTASTSGYFSSTMLNHILKIFHQMQTRQRRPRNVEQLESYIRQEQDNIPLPKHQQLVSWGAAGMGSWQLLTVY